MGDQLFKGSVETTLKVIGGKWKLVILCHLMDGARRFGELRRGMPDITQKMLTQQLRELEEDGIIHREVFMQVPPKVEYSLTPYGGTMGEVLHLLADWGLKHQERVDKEASPTSSDH
ncbi:helix-turn-helix domain-containing protein [Paenibacillus sp. PAMC21692]|uniref:winged helix-turn-helix transcriptional regulator n=1 Tax=Paenibacillus sp. PAMC21692 TaxID=2762320 RepID=UPI00164D4111|nr:helix-turn-helix domain-containing protein [Paenibacillus sp. PAMC21692]QNK57828.1 helix-turn-helix transcriptional regulator [Paenibacillus sp. PAMC21692]